MPDLDVPKYMRLRTAVRNALDSVGPDASSAFRGLVDAYQRLRAEARDAVGDDLVKEFDDLFPATIDLGAAGTGNHSPTAMLKQQEVANTARTLLGQLAGWLDGFIEAAQFDARLQADAEAYAKERIKSERKVGF